MKRDIPPIPTETQEQEALLRWVAFAAAKHPELKLLIHIPNEGKRTQRQGAELKRIGLRPGAPDLLLPVSNEKHNCLFIEMKRTKKSVVSENQKAFIDDLNCAGCKAVVCYGWVEAAKAIGDYLGFKVEGV